VPFIVIKNWKQPKCPSTVKKKKKKTCGIYIEWNTAQQWKEKVLKHLR
jgi:hypothetical protein